MKSGIVFNQRISGRNGVFDRAQIASLKYKLERDTSFHFHNNKNDSG